MANITKEIASLRAKIARLEKEQKQAEEREKALAAVQSQIDALLKQHGLTLETYIRSNFAQVSRIVTKIEREKGKPESTTDARKGKKKAVAKKRRARSSKTAPGIKIPAGKYANLPTAPDKTFEVKEKGPRPKLLKAYAEEVGLETFLQQCRLDG
ncbi:MAG: hypothetical protein P8103_09275 [Candidatus Thiodiazotropha sp.]|jgi:hypothetical protein